MNCTQNLFSFYKLKNRVVLVLQWTDKAALTLTVRLYSLLFHWTSTFTLTIAVGALFFQHTFHQGPDAIYEHINLGKLWKHIKHKYENKE
ncbi:cytochrome b-c1 complex subunit 9-like [Phacochoerus africanus]|uniref:cytochrome b-c1 complex subunit 9-like n=1 Tax=Phacochoerus africanus TaxID=41426 RepID=UPI001FDA2580|nr:cytochrome b-c1 complex subunit 9-like [Phacochoerus africanus]